MRLFKSPKNVNFLFGKLRHCSLQVSFDVDVQVNVFEANIRLLGGLLSAHLLATDPRWASLDQDNATSL